MFNELALLEEGLPHHDYEIYRSNSFRLLDDLAKRIAALNLTLSKADRDGRTNSKLDEKIVCQAIQDIYPDTLLSDEGYRYDIPEERPVNKVIRDWYDIVFMRSHAGYDREIIPVDIKSSLMEQPDNCTGKTGIFYVLTGREPMFANNVGWQKYTEALAPRVNPENIRDLFFVAVKKTNTRFVRTYSLRTLEKVRPNPSNFPFQINWGENTTRIYRSPEASFEFVRGAAFESIKRKIGPMGDLFEVLHDAE